MKAQDIVVVNRMICFDLEELFSYMYISICSIDVPCE